jgi:CheY-like chemotaxis protein
MESTVMVIDSTDAIIDIMEVIFTGAGYRFLSSVIGYTPEQVAAYKPDLILIEDRLHQQPAGRVISKELKLSPLTGAIPIIMMTTLVPVGHLLKDAMADAVLPKPFDVDELEDLVAIILDKTKNQLLK